MRKSVFLLLLGSTALASFGCAHRFPAPRELLEARAAYARASSGDAARLAPARLRLARQALNEAELAYGGNPEQEVRDRAYVALRRIESAETEAAAIAAGQRRDRTLRELATLQGVFADRARAELADAERRALEEQDRALSAEQRATLEQRRAAEEQARAQAAQQQASAEQLRAQQASQQAAEEQARAQAAEQNLVSERQARMAAEARAQQAMTELGRMANVRREARGLVITLSGQVLFASGESTLLPAAASSLDNVAVALKNVPANAGRVVIEGHTDSRGSRGFNMELSQRRAEAVRNFLIGKGVSPDLLVVQGVGPDQPVASNRSAEGRANNRRVEIVIPPPAMASGGLNVPDTAIPAPAVPAPTVPADGLQQPAPTAPRPTTTTPGYPTPAPAPTPAPTYPSTPSPTPTPGYPAPVR